jgi:hypothetical protein
VIERDPAVAVVAVAVRFAAGSAEDPSDLEGTAFLLGHVLQGTGASRLRARGAQVEVDVDRQEILATMIAPVETWREAFQELERALYTDPIGTAEVESARAWLLDVLGFEIGSPVRAFEHERASLVHGPLDPAARPLHGTLGGVSALTADALVRFRELHLRRTNAVVAIFGPVDPAEIAALARGPVRSLGAGPVPGGPSATGRGVVPSATPPTRPAGGDGALAADRTVIDRELTSTWIAAAYPFPPGTSSVGLEFLGLLISEALNSSPPDPGLYEAGATIVQVRGAPVLVLSASVDPGVATRWEDRILGFLPTFAETPPEGALLDLSRRRFRSHLSFLLAAPETRVRWIVRQTALGTGSGGDLQGEIWRLDGPRLAQLAALAAPPRVLLMGPVAMMAR